MGLQICHFLSFRYDLRHVLPAHRATFCWFDHYAFVHSLAPAPNLERTLPKFGAPVWKRPQHLRYGLRPDTRGHHVWGRPVTARQVSAYGPATVCGAITSLAPYNHFGGDGAPIERAVGSARARGGER